MTDFKSQKIKQALKALLKKKGLTYNAVAETLECSVPTVKRILGAEELTLTRLLEFCEILEITLADVDALTKDSVTSEEKFTEAQELFLAKNPSFLAYIMKLFSGDSPKQIAEKYGLTVRSTDKYLVGLEKYELIRVTGRQKVKPAFKTVPSFGDGPLGRLYFESLIASAARFFTEVARDGLQLKKQGVPDHDRPRALWGIHAAKVTRATYDQWVLDQEKARTEFDRLASFEEKTRPENELMTAVIISGNTFLKNDNPRLEILQNMLGVVRNL